MDLLSIKQGFTCLVTKQEFSATKVCRRAIKKIYLTLFVLQTSCNFNKYTDMFQVSNLTVLAFLNVVQARNLIHHQHAKTSTSAKAVNVILHRLNAKIPRVDSIVRVNLVFHQVWTVDQLVI